MIAIVSDVDSFFNMGGRQKRNASSYVLLFVFVIQVFFVGLFILQMNTNIEFTTKVEQELNNKAEAAETQRISPSSPLLRQAETSLIPQINDAAAPFTSSSSSSSLPSSSSGDVGMSKEEEEMLETERAKVELAAKTINIEDISQVKTIKSNAKTSFENVYTHRSSGRPKVHVKQSPVVFNKIKPKPNNARNRHVIRNPEHFLLVVGGTDGSGTRRAVQMLAELGVPMVVEDSTTLDIHADILKDGWPGIVSPFLKYSGSIEADPSYYPDDVRDATIEKLQGVIDKATRDAGYWKDRIDAGVLSMPFNRQASKVFFGVKAPVIMTALPFLHKIIPKLMYLQVVRDGRDIAFSSNTSPVRRFYEDMYGNDVKDTNLIPSTKAIRLWSDWNARSALWARNHTKTTKDGLVNTKDYAIDHHLLKMEDLMDSSVAVRYKAISALAAWVGSTATIQDMCNMAGASIKDYGASVGINRGKGVQQRYGKWKAAQKQVIDELEKYGAEGLELFGYFEDGDADHIKEMHKDLESPCNM